MLEDTSANLVHADYLRVFLTQYQAMQPYIKRLIGDNNANSDEEKKPPRK